MPKKQPPKNRHRTEHQPAGGDRADGSFPRRQSNCERRKCAQCRSDCTTEPAGYRPLALCSAHRNTCPEPRVKRASPKGLPASPLFTRVSGLPARKRPIDAGFRPGDAYIEQ